MKHVDRKRPSVARLNALQSLDMTPGRSPSIKKLKHYFAPNDDKTVLDARGRASSVERDLPL